MNLTEIALTELSNRLAAAERERALLIANLRITQHRLEETQALYESLLERKTEDNNEKHPD